MFDTIGKPFFEALRAAAEQRLEPEHPCRAAIERAAGVGGRDATVAAQAALAALDPDLQAGLMADAHKALRESKLSILDLWPGGGSGH